MRLALCLLAALAGPARADVQAVVTDHVLPGYAALEAATGALARAAAADCAPDAVSDDWNAAYDAWLGVAHLRLGPAEAEGRGQAVAFWPDERDATGRGVAALLGGDDALTPEAVARSSVAARGLLALERLLYEAPDTQRRCDAIRALTLDLERNAAEIAAGWRDGYAETMLTAGGPGNTDFFTPAEAGAALYTILQAGLDVVSDDRLGRPMGTFDRPRPTRAEAWRSGRSQRNVAVSLSALRDLAAGLADAPRTLAALDGAIEAAGALDDPVFAGVADPGPRFRLEALQQRIVDARRIAAEEIGAELGVTEGFNAGDGD